MVVEEIGVLRLVVFVAVCREMQNPMGPVGPNSDRGPDLD